jgi:hypothetical protein
MEDGVGGAAAGIKTQGLEVYVSLYLKRGLACALTCASFGVLALVPASALGSPAHPRLIAGGEEKRVEKAVPALGWGSVILSNHALGFLECATPFIAEATNETEPGGEGNSEKVRAYGKVLSWSATSYMNPAGGELNSHCKDTAGFNTWRTQEPGLRESTEKVTVEGQSRLAISQLEREPVGTPWAQEAQGEEITSGPNFWLTTGMALPVAGTELEHLNTERSKENTEKEEAKAEEAAAGVSTELRTGCYHYPALTEIVREPGFVEARETEPHLRPAPHGCVRFGFVVPEVGLETPVQGTLEPKVVNGVHNGLTPSHGELFGGCDVACSEGSERSSERNARALTSAFGPMYVRTQLNMKALGYISEELLKLK